MDPLALLVLLLLVGLLVIFGRVGRAIGRPKGRPTAGFWLGFFGGLLGWLVIYLLPPTEEAQKERDKRLADAMTAAGSVEATPSQASLGEERLCPFCAESIKAAATKCKHCGSEVPSAE